MEIQFLLIVFIAFVCYIIGLLIIFRMDMRACKRRNKHFDFTTENGKKIIVHDKKTINNKVRR